MHTVRPRSIASTILSMHTTTRVVEYERTRSMHIMHQTMIALYPHVYQSTIPAGTIN